MDVRFRMDTEIEYLYRRIDKIEKQNYQDVLTLVEILSNATFFGKIKQSNCNYSKDGQCSFYILKSEEKNKIPIATECRIKQCNEPSFHCHIELSKISCTLCPQRTIDGPLISSNKPQTTRTKIQKTRKEGYKK